MSTVIWKFDLSILAEGPQTIETGLAAPVVLHVGKTSQTPRGSVSVWVQGDKQDFNTESLRLMVVGTGQTWREYYAEYWGPVGSVIDDPFVWHVLQDFAYGDD